MIESLATIVEAVEAVAEKASTFFDKLEETIEVEKPEIAKQEESVKSFWETLEEKISANTENREKQQVNTDESQNTLDTNASESNNSNSNKTDDTLDPKDNLSDEQIETLRSKYEKIGLPEEEIEAKIQEYTKKDKACKEAEEKGLDNLSTHEKGNYGEMKADLDLLDKGYVLISKDGVTNLNHNGHKGIDGVYENPDGKPKYIIIDAKYGSSQLNKNTADGKQLSDTWIDNRLDAAVGKEKADEIRKSSLSDDVGVAEVRIDSDGNVTYAAIDDDGEYEDNKEVFVNG